METSQNTSADSETERVLAVIDWSVDPSPVVETMLMRDDTRSTVFDVLVPASLPAIGSATRKQAVRARPSSLRGSRSSVRPQE